MPGSEGGATTVGEQLQQKYMLIDDRRKQMSAAQKRIQRRKDYMEEVGQVKACNVCHSNMMVRFGWFVEFCLEFGGTVQFLKLGDNCS